MREIIVYSISAIAALTVLGYTVHMFVGGLVEPGTERLLIAGACGIGVIVIGLMAWDVMRRRKGL